jgi:hypothetical protein
MRALGLTTVIGAAPHGAGGSQSRAAPPQVGFEPFRNIQAARSELEPFAAAATCPAHIRRSGWPLRAVQLPRTGHQVIYATEPTI